MKSIVVYEYKCSKDKSIQYIGNFFETINRETLKIKKQLYLNILVCNNCKYKRITLNSINILKELRSKFDTLISEAFLIKRYNQTLNKKLTKPGKPLRIFDKLYIFYHV